MRQRIMAGLAGLMLAGCMQETPAPPDACGAGALQTLRGQPGEALDGIALEGPVRVLPPGAMMTMDHRPERLNAELDEAGRITRLWCG
ncbi:Peptidase inhibitor I78 family protein [Roseovarius litoreus]|uniref:Peptidase inhibitor I78 family protein n=1 Tax=Roseovarius litoreus TaxID=1155722 RepID=A0A1M7AD66_9RHOB|nr:I78 family peptidase inhibitor [Roseovarius litoreus]SHL40555.1 Peptidase inhibitor I78 family protein [Roseovarius litoreus]